MTWQCAPALIVLLLPRLWPALARFVAPVVVTVLDSTPIGVALSLAGQVGRGPLVECVLRMIALQMAAAVVFFLWAIVRLRPASRAAYDADARSASRRLLRRRWLPRPRCGDDPVLWHELYPGQFKSRATIWVDRLVTALWVGALLYGLSWFARPAFAELFERGYGAGIRPSAAIEVNPIARFILSMSTGLAGDPAPGEARLELNFVLRLLTGAFHAFYVLYVAGAAAQSVATERERNTWLGLISTPLTGWEILRAKLLGAVWRTRGVPFLLFTFWIIGLLAGALHPVGFLAGIMVLGVSCWSFAALGVSVSLSSADRAQASAKILGPTMIYLSLGVLPFFTIAFILPATASVLPASVTTPFLAWLCVLSYEDVGALLTSGSVAHFAAAGLLDVTRARLVLLIGVISLLVHAVGAYFLLRSALRTFDATVGRPTRPRCTEGVVSIPMPRRRAVGRGREILQRFLTSWFHFTHRIRITSRSVRQDRSR
jgi:hypothetical protein